MNSSTWFDDLPVLGKLPPEDVAAKLRELGEDEAATAMEAAQMEETRGATFGPGGRRRRSRDKASLHTAHAFGYLELIPPGSNEPFPIQHAGNIAPDTTLKESRIRITLDRLRVADYPGKGVHHVLFDFYAQNQVPGNPEHLHFNATHRVREGEHAGIIGYPIFVGLNVGTEGVSFKCFTVNVKNDDDEAFLGFLDSDVFKAGLKLATTFQPPIAPFSHMAVGLTRNIAGRNKNVPVQDFYMGLDFSTVGRRARLLGERVRVRGQIDGIINPSPNLSPVLWRGIKNREHRQKL